MRSCSVMPPARPRRARLRPARRRPAPWPPRAARFPRCRGPRGSRSRYRRSAARDRRLHRRDRGREARRADRLRVLEPADMGCDEIALADAGLMREMQASAFRRRRLRPAAPERVGGRHVVGHVDHGLARAGRPQVGELDDARDRHGRIDDVDPEMRRHRTPELHHDADHADVGDAVVGGARLGLGQVRGRGGSTKRRRARCRSRRRPDGSRRLAVSTPVTRPSAIADLPRRLARGGSRRRAPRSPRTSAWTSVSEPPSM